MRSTMLATASGWPMTRLEKKSRISARSEALLAVEDRERQAGQLRQRLEHVVTARDALTRTFRSAPPSSSSTTAPSPAGCLRAEVALGDVDGGLCEALDRRWRRWPSSRDGRRASAASASASSSSMSSMRTISRRRRSAGRSCCSRAVAPAWPPSRSARVRPRQAGRIWSRMLALWLWCVPLIASASRSGTYQMIFLPTSSSASASRMRPSSWPMYICPACRSAPLAWKTRQPFGAEARA